MKNNVWILLLVCALSSTNIFAQKLTEQETKDLRKQNTLLRTKYNDQFALFVLKQDTAFYNQAIIALKQEVDNLNKLISFGYDDGSQISKTYISLYPISLQANESFLSYYGANFWRDKILNDKEKCNKSVTYNEVEYKVSKMRYEELEHFLPKK